MYASSDAGRTSADADQPRQLGDRIHLPDLVEQAQQDLLSIELLAEEPPVEPGLDRTPEAQAQAGRRDPEQIAARFADDLGDRAVPMTTTV